jgi:hypothetical protein
MHEAIAKIRFTLPVLGNTKDASGRFLLPRDADGRLIFLPSWHQANLRMASRALGRFRREVEKLRWDLPVRCDVASLRWQKRYVDEFRYATHETIPVGTTVGLVCLLPRGLDFAQLAELLVVAGKYRGLSPFHPGEYGLFTVQEVTHYVPEFDDVVGLATGNALTK